MRLNTLLLLFSVLTLFVSINATPVPLEQKRPIDPGHSQNPDDDDIQKPNCTVEESIVANQKRNCDNVSGKFIRNYPVNCKVSYVCLIPCINKTLNGVEIEYVRYCSAHYSSYPSCKFDDDEYNFTRCLEQTSNDLDFYYRFPPKTKIIKAPKSALNFDKIGSNKYDILN